MLFMLIYGINPVLEALRARRVRELRVGERVGGRVSEIVRSAEQQSVAVRRVSTADLDRAAKGGVHQGVVADLHELDVLDVTELVGAAKGPALIVVLDSIEDPHNVGAILRTVDAAGGDGLVRQTRH